MRLTDKLDSIPREHVVVELDVMLDHAQVSSISWYGQRLVSIEGYEGTVDVNELVAKYHSAMPRFRDGAGDLKARLDYYNLWTKVKTVCKDNRALNDTWVYRFLVPMKERSYLCRGARPAPMEFIISKAKGTKFPSKNECCFSFTESDFNRLFPNEQPDKVELISQRWVATKDMVEVAYRRGMS